MRTEHDRGNAVMVIMAVATLTAALSFGLARMAATVARHDQAQAAADAAALAGASGGRSAAERLAEVNGGVLVSYRHLDSVTVEVVVRCGSTQATARATRAP